MSSTVTPVADTESLPLKLLHVLAMGFLREEEDEVAKLCRVALLTGGAAMARTLRDWSQQPDTEPRDRLKLEAVADSIEQLHPLKTRLGGKQVTRALLACAGSSDSFLHEEGTRLLAVLNPDAFADQLVVEALLCKTPAQCERFLLAAATARRPLSWSSRNDLQIMLQVKLGRALAAARSLLATDDQRRGLAVP